jgi:hypothetical protein
MLGDLYAWGYKAVAVDLKFAKGGKSSLLEVIRLLPLAQPLRGIYP